MRRLGNTRVYRPLEICPLLGMSSQVADILLACTSTDINTPPPGSCPIPITSPYYAAAWWTRNSKYNVYKTVVPASTGSSYTFSGTLSQELIVNTNSDSLGSGYHYSGAVSISSLLDGVPTLLGTYAVLAEPLGVRYAFVSDSYTFSFPVAAGSSVEIQANATPSSIYSDATGQMNITLNALSVVCN